MWATCDINKYTQCGLNLQTRGIVEEILVWEETVARRHAIEGKATVVACAKVGKSLIS